MPNEDSVAEGSSPTGFQIPKSHIASFLAGSIAGGCGVIVGHPFDSLKVRLQVGQTLEYKKFNLYVVKQLYRGIVPPLLTVGTLQAINFSNYEYFKRKIPQYLYELDDLDLEEGEPYLNNEYHTSHAKTTLSTVFLAGYSSGMVMSVITNPMNIVKIRMQVASDLGLAATARDVYKMSGKSFARGFYRGFDCSFLTEGFGRAIYLWVYEYTKLQVVRLRRPDYQYTPGYIVNDTKYIDIWTRVIGAATAGIFSWLICYPADVVRTKVQLDIARLNYKNALDCIQKTWAKEGIKGFYRGLSYTLIRAGPVSVTILPTYDISKEYFEKCMEDM
jgi:solute carrier family 25 carnitine/acylcarnitine transporter 20/29